jgi:hypothetical protein
MPADSGQDAETVDPAANGNGSGHKGSAVTAAKRRPTPKRSEAERRRRQPFNAPKDRKEASRVYRERDRKQRSRRSEALRRGEDWALPARDRGQVRALARDFVDSRRRISEFYMYGLLVLMALLFVRTPLIQTMVPIFVESSSAAGSGRWSSSGCPARAPGACACTPPCGPSRSASSASPSPASAPGQTTEKLVRRATPARRPLVGFALVSFAC